MKFQAERPGVVSSDVILHWQSTIVGVQSVVSFARSDLGQSQQSASECINMNRQMNLPSVFTIMPLFYSLSVRIFSIIYVSLFCYLRVCVILYFYICTVII